MVKFRSYAKHPIRRYGSRKLVFLAGATVIIIIAAAAAGLRYYLNDLKAVNNSQNISLVTIATGETSTQIAEQLHRAGLIRSAWAFDVYVHLGGAPSALEAGTYALRPSETVGQIVGQLVKGQVATKLVTILPGQRLDQVRQTLINAGFSPLSVDNALNPASYPGLPALATKPPGNSLEGYLYPDSFQKTSSTSAKTIVEESINEMGQHLTPSLTAAFTAEGLTTYQGIILASIVEQEVSKPSDQAQVAQVFLSRLHDGMKLGSDVTAYYGAIVAGQPPSLTFDSPYNTLLHHGLPPTPISNVNQQALNAVAHPANTTWLYFVSGDNGITYFSHTLQKQQANVALYCHKLCSQ